MIADKVYISNATFMGRNMKSVDLRNVEWVNNSMNRAFYLCGNLRSVSNINENVTHMRYAFQACPNLVNVPSIPDGVVDMYSTFGFCSNLVNAPIIPNSVTNMGGTFYSCSNLVGDIYMYSENIFNAINCFFGSRLTKNVYIPFTYENGVNTQTYNSFINAGYDKNGTSCGVYLKDLNSL